MVILKFLLAHSETSEFPYAYVDKFSALFAVS